MNIQPLLHNAIETPAGLAVVIKTSDASQAKGHTGFCINRATVKYHHEGERGPVRWLKLINPSIDINGVFVGLRAAVGISQARDDYWLLSSTRLTSIPVYTWEGLAELAVQERTHVPEPPEPQPVDVVCVGNIADMRRRKNWTDIGTNPTLATIAKKMLSDPAAMDHVVYFPRTGALHFHTTRRVDPSSVVARKR